MLFDFGAPGFWEPVQEVRVAALSAAARQRVPLVVMTLCYSAPDDLPTVERFKDIVRREGGRFLPVFLHCDEAEIMRRIGNADRVERGKTSSIEGLRKFRAHDNDAPVPRDHCIRLETTRQTTDAVAAEIVGRFGLGTA